MKEAILTVHSHPKYGTKGPLPWWGFPIGIAFWVWIIGRCFW
jgi:hypothetical protein